MNLKENITRIKKIIESINENNFEIEDSIFDYEGDLSNSIGLKIKNKKNNEKIGHVVLCKLIYGLTKDPILKKYFDLENQNNKIFNTENTLYLHDMFIEPEHRNKGIGKIILKQAHNKTLENGFDYVVLGTETNNLVANKLYTGSGYNEFLNPEEKYKFYYIKL
jgi:hypothetical protein